VLQERREDVGGVDEEVRPEEARRLLAELGEIFLQFRLLVAPGEIRVRLLEADLAQQVHHRRLGERLGQEDHVRVRAAYLRQQPGPEADRLGVWIVHPEDPYAVGHPQPDDAQALGGDAGRITIEVDRIDVLILLRRVLRVGDAAVGPDGEPFRMIFDPRMIRGAGDREIEGHLQAQRLRLGDETVERLEVAQVRMDRVVTSLGTADGVDRAGIVGTRVEGVVATLAERLPDRMDRRHVDDVEAHRRRGLEPLVGGVEGAGDPALLRLVVVGTL
jgi:hypothetical protein